MTDQALAPLSGLSTSGVVRTDAADSMIQPTFITHGPVQLMAEESRCSPVTGSVALQALANVERRRQRGGVSEWQEVSQ